MKHLYMYISKQAAYALVTAVKFTLVIQANYNKNN